MTERPTCRTCRWWNRIQSDTPVGWCEDRMSRHAFGQSVVMPENGTCPNHLSGEHAPRETESEDHG